MTQESPKQNEKRSGNLSKKQIAYSRDLPKKLYLYFLSTAGAGEIPSLGKFAVANGMTLERLQSFRSHDEFDRAVRECSEIRRDYLIDQALCKRADASFVKFLLAAEYGMGDKEEREDRDLDVTLTVIR